MEYANITNFDPRTCISGAVRRINTVTATIFRKYLQPFNITSSQTSILFILSKTAGKTQTDLTRITQLEKSSINRNIKRLSDRDLISKNEFPTLQITEKGMSLVNDIIPEWEKAMAEISSILESDGIAAVKTIHTKLIPQHK